MWPLPKPAQSPFKARSGPCQSRIWPRLSRIWPAKLLRRSQAGQRLRCPPRRRPPPALSGARRAPERVAGLTFFALGLDGGHRRGQELAHHPAEFRVGDRDPLLIEVLADFAHDVLVAFFEQIRLAHGL